MKIKTCKQCGITGTDGIEFRKKHAICKPCEASIAKARMVEWRKTDGYRKWREENRERARAYKEKYRRQAGIPSRSEKAVAAIAKRNAKEEARLFIDRLREGLHDAHVKAMRALPDKDRAAWRYKTDPKYCLYHRLKRWMQKHIGSPVSSKKWALVLGYTADELKQHIERQFVDGMGWHNKGEWHIDHIIPVAAFEFESENDTGFKQAYAITNLRPMWAADNIRKGARIEYLL